LLTEIIDCICQPNELEIKKKLGGNPKSGGTVHPGPLLESPLGVRGIFPRAQHFGLAKLRSEC